MNIIPEQIVNSCCFFIMKENITPMWEDKNNRNGGYFSYRIANKYVFQTWKELAFVLTGESISNNNLFVSNVNGISISPKKNFCVIKIWMKTVDYQNPELITNQIKSLIPTTALFKVHTPEF
jgi:translation initiation factor 4E